MQNQKTQDRIEEATKPYEPDKWKHFSAFQSKTTLYPGERIVIDYTYKEKDCEQGDISALVNMDEDVLYELLNRNIRLERKVLHEAEEAVKKWKEVVPETKLIISALNYKSCGKIKHTNNEWVKVSEPYEYWVKSNSVYEMRCRFYETTKMKKNGSVVKKWHVCFRDSIRGPKHNSERFDFADEEEMFKDKTEAINSWLEECILLVNSGNLEIPKTPSIEDIVKKEEE